MLVAIVGAGVGGCISLKNCIEEGFDVVCLERESAIGGLWRQKDDQTVTTCMEDTMTNFSKHRMATTDFVFPDDAPLFPKGKDMLAFIESYAKHFDLLQHIVFNVTVKSVDLHPADINGQRFLIKYADAQGRIVELVVNRIIVATGLHTEPKTPAVPGIENFRGETLHSRGLRSGVAYKGKKVIIVGSRSSAADACTAMVNGGASEVYLSHRGGIAMIPRFHQGKPFDWLLTRRLALFQGTLEKIKTYSSGWLHKKVIHHIMTTAFDIKKEWGISPPPDTRSSVPTISDSLYGYFESRRVVPVPGIASIRPDSTVVLTDGREISADVIIFATGYKSSPGTTLPFSQDVLNLLRYDPATHSFPRYHYQLSLYLPELCFMTELFSPIGAPAAFDIRSMWIAGVWSGAVKLPSISKMIASANKDKKWIDGLYKFGAVAPGTTPLGALFALAREAGCADDHLHWFSGSSWEGWKWWWSHRELSRLVLDGPDLPAAYRLRGRKKWDGAEAVIRRANEKKLESSKSA